MSKFQIGCRGIHLACSKQEDRFIENRLTRADFNRHQIGGCIDASTQAIDNDCHRRLAGAVSDLGFARMKTLEPITLHPLGMMLSHARARVASMHGSVGTVLVVD